MFIPGTAFNSSAKLFAGVLSMLSDVITDTVAGALTIYEVATRQYRRVGDVRGEPYAWLHDGRLVVGPPSAPRLVDPATARTWPVTMPSFGDLRPARFEISRDGTVAYFPLTSSLSDIWLVGLTGEDGG